MKEKDKIIYADFKSDPGKTDRKSSLNASFHSNPVIDKLFRLVHTKLSNNKEDYKSYTDFKPEDLL